MSRTPRVVVTPGDPDSDNAGLPPAETFVTDETGMVDIDNASIAPPKDTQPLKGTEDQVLASLQAQMAEMMANQRQLAEQNAQLVRQLNRGAVQMPEPVELPSVAEAMSSNPDAAVLTRDGWYAPPVTSANPVRTK